MNKLDKMKKMVDGILGDDDLCEGCEYVVEGLTCAECRRKYADEIIKILRMPEVAKMVDEADTPQTDCEACELDGKSDVCKICRVSNYELQTDCPWK